ncbi:lamin tail domain-containing protein [Verrucomicrobiales bacterium]|nr:lamin tail domain-containing protein [Verrucomicrobiales bacterium]
MAYFIVMSPIVIFVKVLTVLGLSLTCCVAANTKRYLFLGHPRDAPGEVELVQREVERIDYSAYDLLLLGGDYTFQSTSSRESMDYLNAIFSLSEPTTLAVIGNHEGPNLPFFTDVTMRPRFYSYESDGITFVVLNTTDTGRNVLGGELEMLESVVETIESSHLVLIHHHFVWLADYAPLAHLQGSPLIGTSSRNLSDLNFYDAVYPLLLDARNKGVEVLCLAGDRTGVRSAGLYIDHTTEDGIRYIGTGMQERMLPSLRYTVVLEHDIDEEILDYEFVPLSELPKIDDEPLVINEIYYDPHPDEGNRTFIELFNRGTERYSLSKAKIHSGLSFTFPEGTVVEPCGYVLIAADPSQHAELGVQVFKYDEDVLLQDGILSIRNEIGLEVDHVDYSSVANTEEGFSLSLIDSDSDNSLLFNWASPLHLGGTPGRKNSLAPSESVPATSSNVRVTEIHYSPSSPTKEELAAGITSTDQFEYIELTNISPSETVSLEGVQFVAGVTFTFDSDTKSLLSPGGRLVIVSDTNAFQLRHPCAILNVAGTFTGSLSDEGEWISLFDSNGLILQELVYDSSPPWPFDPRGGHSLVASDEKRDLDFSDPEHWQFSIVPNGTPGDVDAVPFVSEATQDVDADGYGALLEYAMGSSGLDGSSQSLLGTQLESLDIDGATDSYLVLEFSKNLASTGIDIDIELSSNLDDWHPADGELIYHSTSHDGAGTATQRYRSLSPFLGVSTPRLFYRLRVENGAAE